MTNNPEDEDDNIVNSVAKLFDHDFSETEKTQTEELIEKIADLIADHFKGQKPFGVEGINGPVALRALSCTIVNTLMTAWTYAGEDAETLKQHARDDLRQYVAQVASFAASAAEAVGNCVGQDIIATCRSVAREAYAGEDCPDCGKVHVSKEGHNLDNPVGNILNNTIGAYMDEKGELKDISEMPEEEKEKVRAMLRGNTATVIIPNEIRQQMEEKGISEDEIRAALMKGVGGLHS